MRVTPSAAQLLVREILAREGERVAAQGSRSRRMLGVWACADLNLGYEAGPVSGELDNGGTAPQLWPCKREALLLAFPGISMVFLV